MTIKNFIPVFLFGILFFVACKDSGVQHQVAGMDSSFSQNEFGYDLHFLMEQDSTLVVLKDGDAALIVSPKYQAKVFTSTASGDRGFSFGWINYRAFGKEIDVHMNAFGGENRIWLGPEGGRYSLFFKADSPMVYENWKTPPPFDTESWILYRRDSHQVVLFKNMSLTNYQGVKLSLRVDRTVNLLRRDQIADQVGIKGNDSLHIIAYETENQLTNTGDFPWTAATGMPCIWMLDMFKPTASTIIVLPFKYFEGERWDQVATTNYFGQIPSERLQHTDSLLFFKADGKSRGKLGIRPKNAKNIAGSYDPENSVLTIIIFEVDASYPYLNQEWNTVKPPFSGDAVNAYNDGPLTNGTQMGPFYEMESVSPAAYLKPKETLSHKHSVFHFSGSVEELNKISLQLLGNPLADLRQVFAGGKKS